MLDITPFVVVVKIVAFGIGGVVTSLAYRAARRTGSVALRTLTVGAAVLSLSVVVDGRLAELLGWGPSVGILLDSVLLLGGFTALGYSLYVTDPNLTDDDRSLPNRDTGD